ncbi:tyrosine-type recombinase/integrase [Haloferax marisrubri]|uniref:Integrase n=1 Tax=Haloferax marisrubri TaxID=1544719 RepID=A0A2P4NKZ7_9EURY|nr:site-specific integrase [Haloferax marisrubri]POG53813.1 hypothetical protein AUR65_018755 [Haloferax marisrubri]
MTGYDPYDHPDQVEERQLNEWGVTDPQVREYLLKESGIKLAPSTTRRRACTLRLFTAFLDEQGTSVIGAEKQDIIDYLASCSVKGNRMETVRNKRSAVKALYKFLHAHSDRADELKIKPEFVGDIPIRGFRYKTRESMNRVPLTEDELNKLYDAIETHRNQLIVTIGAETGLRNAEIRELKISDVDLDELTLHVRDGKGGKSHTVAISEALAVNIRQWIELERSARPGAEECDYLFISENGGGKIETNEGLSRFLKDAAEEAGIQDTLGEIYLTERQKEVMNTDNDTKVMHKVTAHALRHTFNHKMKKSGLSLETRSKAMNHSHPSVTKDNYDHDEENYNDLIRDLIGR